MRLFWAGRVCADAKSDEIELTYYPQRGQEPLRGNLGVRRNTSADILQRWEHECAQRLPDFCDARVVLSCGVNDMVIEAGQQRVSIAESCKNVRHILQRASATYSTILIGPAPVGDEELNSRLKVLSAAYAQVAAELGIPFVEIFSHLIANQQYLQESRKNDGYHPRSFGYTAIANIIAASNFWWFSQTPDSQQV